MESKHQYWPLVSKAKKVYEILTTEPWQTENGNYGPYKVRLDTYVDYGLFLCALGKKEDASKLNLYDSCLIENQILKGILLSYFDKTQSMEIMKKTENEVVKKITDQKYGHRDNTWREIIMLGHLMKSLDMDVSQYLKKIKEEKMVDTTKGLIHPNPTGGLLPANNSNPRHFDYDASSIGFDRVNLLFMLLEPDLKRVNSMYNTLIELEKPKIKKIREMRKEPGLNWEPTVMARGRKESFLHGLILHKLGRFEEVKTIDDQIMRHKSYDQKYENGMLHTRAWSSRHFEYRNFQLDVTKSSFYGIYLLGADKVFSAGK